MLVNVMQLNVIRHDYAYTFIHLSMWYVCVMCVLQLNGSNRKLQYVNVKCMSLLYLVRY